MWGRLQEPARQIFPVPILKIQRGESGGHRGGIAKDLKPHSAADAVRRKNFSAFQKFVLHTIKYSMDKEKKQPLSGK